MFEILDPQAVDYDAPGEQVEYAVVADPQEQDITIDEPYEAIICTGDILNLAPAPGATDGIATSLLSEYEDTLEAVNGYGDVESMYAAGDVDAILQSISEVTDYPAAVETAVERYKDYFDAIDTDFYYIAGNQDIPQALDEAADAYEDVQHVDKLDGVTGIDGLVPEFAGIPKKGYFPTEQSVADFYMQMYGADARDVLVTHTVPDAGLTDVEFDTVIGSKRDRSLRNVDESTAALSPHGDGDYVLIRQRDN